MLEEEDDDEDDEEDVNDATPSSNKIQHRTNHDSHNNRPIAREVEERINTSSKRELEHSNETKRNETKKLKSNNNNDDHRTGDKRKDYWLYCDIVVRIISKKLAKGEYYKRKAIIDKVIGKLISESCLKLFLKSPVTILRALRSLTLCL